MKTRDHALLLLMMLALPAGFAGSAPAKPAMAGAAKSGHQLQYLRASDFAPSRLLPPPPAPGSKREAQEMAALRAVIAAATPERHAQAFWDGKHKNPHAFDAVMGVDLSTLPATWTLLKTVQDEAAAAAGFGKDYFHRPRPYEIDPTIPRCSTSPDDSHRSYPSGHATFGYSVGYALAQLAPAKSQQILARASDYAFSREICGVHFPSDTEASHVIGTLVAAEMFADPRLAGQIAAARAELARR